jgi:nucleoside-diphosphate-sugar epimerase
MKQKVLITGNNGVLGKNMVEYLEKYAPGEYELVLMDLVHPPDHIRKYKTVRCDIRDKQQVEETLKDIDIVLHCASASPTFTEEEILDIIVGGTRTLLEGAFKTGKAQRFVYISSTSVYGVPEKAPTTEQDAVQPYDPYNKGKIIAEGLCEQWRRQGKCVTILRPRSFLGLHRLGTFAILYEWASEGRHFPMLGKGTNRYQLLDVEDLCQAVHMAMINDRVKVNDLFNIGAKEFSSIREDYQAVMDAAGYGKRIICFPARPMTAALYVLEKLKLSPFYKRLYMKLNKDHYVSLDKAVNQLGYRPKYSNQDSLVRNYKWYLEHQAKTKDRSTGLGNNSLWNQGAIKYAKYFF